MCPGIQVVNVECIGLIGSHSNRRAGAPGRLVQNPQALLERKRSKLLKLVKALSYRQPSPARSADFAAKW